MPDYKKKLNSAQLEAVTCQDRHVLVAAGAGSGKTRTIVYRLAWLVEQGVAPETILLLTFTRKAAHEMLVRAANLLNRGLEGISGGTFHSFAYSILRRFPPQWLEGRLFTLMDAADMNHVLRQCKEGLKIGKKDSSFPKIATVAALVSKSRNKEIPVEEILRREAFHLLPHAQAIEDIGREYASFKRRQAQLDYDDLLFELHEFLAADGRAAAIKRRYGNILVDEYQDTNLVQARIVHELAKDPETGEASAVRVMAVGDEAQSIYAFRGANVRNILDFPKLFPGARVIKLEENYRSTRPILSVANDILSSAAESYDKKLFTNSEGGEPVRKILPLSDASEAQLITNRIRELLGWYPPNEIAVLFRSGFHSYQLENALRKAGIPFRKYGGMRFVEASHIKDVVAFARLVLNTADSQAFSRVAAMHHGVGAKTAAKLQLGLQQGKKAQVEKMLARFPGLRDDINLIDSLRSRTATPEEIFEIILEHYRPRLEMLYPEDWPSRLPGLEELVQIARNYTLLDLFIADMALEAPEDGLQADDGQHITLSTVHSAKGLEWNVVLLLDMVEDRFPSRHAQIRQEDFEEERRLFYVACTRARQLLELYAPLSIYSRAEHYSLSVNQSPFLREISSRHTIEFIEKYDGQLALKTGFAPVREEPEKKSESAGSLYCRHRIFGRGKIVRKLDKEKMQVEFPGFGLKTILSDYLVMED